MKILIIEDEPLNANRIKRFLNEIEPESTIIGPASSISETVMYLNEHNDFDLILADIQLTDGLSFDAISQTNCNAPIIFTTAYDNYAVQAFKFNSIDYLLKPINIEEFSEAIRKVKKRAQTDENLSISKLLQAMKQSNYKYKERFLVPFRDELIIVSVSEINHITIDNRKVFLRLNNGTQHNISIPMDELEEQLNPELFFRANRQYIISSNGVKRISTHFAGKLSVRMNGWEDENILISRDKVAQFKEWLV